MRLFANGNNQPSERLLKYARKAMLWLAATMFVRPIFAASLQFYPVTIYTATQAVAAVTSGDFDPIHPGNELACLMANGDVVELALGSSGWTATTVFKNPGSAPGSWPNPAIRATLDLGNVLSANPGNELVLSIQQEAQRQVLAVYFAPAVGWTNQVIVDFSDLIGTSWGARVGNCDPAHEGDEVFCIYEAVFDQSVGFLFHETNGVWVSNLVYSAEVGMDSAIGDLNPASPGNEIIVATEMGPTYEVTPPAHADPGPWPKRTIWDDFTNAGWVVKIGDVDPQSPENEIVYGTRYSDRIMLSRHNGTNTHNVEILFTGSNTNEDLNNMLDIAIGQLFPASPAKEILGVDASGFVYAVQRMASDWQGAVLWRDTNALYAVCAADLLPTPGDEVVVASASGVVTLLVNPSPILSATLTSDRKTVLSWNSVTGLTYAVETATSLIPGSSWSHLANLAYNDGFHGVLSYTNAPGNAATQSLFRLRTSW